MQKLYHMHKKLQALLRKRHIFYVLILQVKESIEK